MLLVTAVTLAGAGYWNYLRSAPLDRELELPRPYRTLSPEQLGDLIAAYRGEAEGARQRLSGTSTGAEAMRGFRAADFEGRVKGFDRFQRQNRAWRDLRGSAFEAEAAVADLERELRIREAGLDVEWRRVLRRVTAF